MSRRSFSIATLTAFVLIASLACVDVKVAAREHESAEQLVAEALHREIYGLQSDRDRLLAAAVAADPNYAPARWHQGYLSVGGQWSHVYDAPRIIGTSSVMAAYRKLREECSDTLEDHLQLANWCSDRRMPDQQRAHLSRVLDFDPDHAEARERLGFRLSNGQWIEGAAIQRQAQARASWQQSLEDWHEARAWAWR